jgi:uncharacterized protein with PIN domain
MVLDTSAIIATITNEQDSSRFRAAMLGAESLLISSVSVLETKIVLFARLGLDAVGLFESCWRMPELSWSRSTTKWQKPPSMRFAVSAMPRGIRLN